MATRGPDSRRLEAQAAEETRAFLRLAYPVLPAEGQPPAADAPESGWLLESVAEGGKLRQMVIQPLPFRIGRRSGLELVLPSYLVSKAHSEIYEAEGTLRIRDLDSRNGTFVNRRPVADSPLVEGDILHLGDFEFRVGRRDPAVSPRADSTLIAPLSPSLLSRHFVQGTREIHELLAEVQVTVEIQPIVRFPDGRVSAHEALGRGTHPGLPRNPVDLFGIAEGAGVEAELSRLLRRKAVELACGRSDVAALFLNTHPSELLQPGLLESMEALRGIAPHLDLILEIHETALAEPEAMASLRDRLSEMNIGLAYDDFGNGQARLLELAEAPPHYLKFDRRFVAGIDQAPPARRRLLASLVAAARELLVKTVAEGVETAAEADACARLGFTHGQGYYFGRPAPFDKP